MNGRRIRVGAVLVVTAIAALLGATLLALVATTPVQWNGGCGDDGLNYCHMVVGGNVTKPWSRRILLSAIVKVVAPAFERDAVPVRFLVANTASLVVQAAVASSIAARLCTRARSRRVAAMAAAGLVLSAPMALRWVWMYPVLVDPFAAALGGLSVVSLASHRRVQLTAPVLTALATLSREIWGPLLVVAAAVMLFGTPRDAAGAMASLRHRALLFAAICAAAATALVVVLRAPGITDPVVDGLDYYTGYFEIHVLTAAGRRQLAWLALFALGVVPLVVLIRPLRFLGWTWEHPRRPLLATCLVLTAANACLGVVGGADFHRFMASVAPFAFGAGVAAALSLLGDAPLLPAVVASAAIWRPWEVPDGSHEDYYRIFSPHYISIDAVNDRAAIDVRIVGVALAVAAALYWAPLLVRRARGEDGDATVTMPPP